MDGIYYKVIACILLFPWALVGLTVVGYFRRTMRRRDPGAALRANVLETPTPFEFSVEGGEVLSNGIQE